MQFCCSDLIHSEALSVAVDLYFMIRLPTFVSRCWQCLLALLRKPVGYIHSFYSKLDIVRIRTLLRAIRAHFFLRM